MKWINFLHIYQPPTQTKEIVDRVTKESYRLIINLLTKYPRLKLTMNINGSLLELWEKYGYKEIINDYKTLVESGKIELVGSAMYHPILPLIPIEEMKQQIVLNNEISKRLLGSSFKPTGFYIPEMAYSDEAGEVISTMGFDWVILDEIHLGKKIDPSVKYNIKNIGLSVIFRNNTISRTFPPESVIEKSLYEQPFLVTAHDGEMYGHWHSEDNGYYERAFTSQRIEFITGSEYLHSLKKEKSITLRNASWESTEDEIGNNIPYSLWDNPNNEIHKQLWNLAHYASSLVKNSKKDAGKEIASHHLSRGLSSCAWWWSSERKLGPFSPITWNPTEIEKGATELIMAIRALKNINDEPKQKSEKIFKDLRDTVWNKHWAKQHEKA